MASYSVGQLANLAKVAVRTLRHYDEVGLLSPSSRTPSGRHQYSDDDLDRLREILFYRERGFPLEEIAAILDHRSVSPSAHLRRQRDLVSERIRRLQRLSAAVERTLEARRTGVQLTPEEKFEVFGSEYQESWETEAEEQWGDTDAWKQFRGRSTAYSKTDWQCIQAEGAGLNSRLVEALTAGVQADSSEAMDLAEEHRRYMAEHFYDCSYTVHRGLAAMYLADARFTVFYENLTPGLAQWLHDAITANADRAET